MTFNPDIPNFIPNQSLGGRRGEARFTFNASQRIAPCTGESGALPTTEDYVTVRCFDLSRNGISYILPQPPAYDTVVVELSLPKQRLYLKARVAHITGMTLDGKFVFQVGCEFTGRVPSPRPDEQPEVAAQV